MRGQPLGQQRGRVTGVDTVGNPYGIGRRYHRDLGIATVGAGPGDPVTDAELVDAITDRHDRARALAPDR